MMTPNGSNLEGAHILERDSTDAVRVELLYESETISLDEKRTTDLLGTDLHAVSFHLKKVYTSGEADFGGNSAKNRKSLTKSNLRGEARDPAIQPRRDDPGRVSSQEHTCHSVPSIVGPDPAREHREGLRTDRQADQTSSGHPHQRAAMLPQDHRDLRSVQHRLRLQYRKGRVSQCLEFGRYFETHVKHLDSKRPREKYEES